MTARPDRTPSDDDVDITVRVRRANLQELEEGVTLGIDLLTSAPIRLRLLPQPDGTHALETETGVPAMHATADPVDVVELPLIRCTECGLELTSAQAQAINDERCPRCGSKGVPMLISDDVDLRVNWHELRILGIWAEQWANAMPVAAAESEGAQRTVNVICGRIQAQHPEKAPLTLSGEIAALRQEPGIGDVLVQGFREDGEANANA